MRARPMTDSERVIAYVSDLLDRSRIAAAFDPGAVVFARTASELDALIEDAAPARVLIDLSRPDALSVAADLRRRLPEGAAVIGYGSHVDRALLDAARAAGCTDVLARSVFFARLASPGRLG